MKHPLAYLLAGLAAGVASAQEEPSAAVVGFPPSKTIEASRVSVFQDGVRETGNAFSNFRLFLRYDAKNPVSLKLVNGKHAVELPAGDDLTADLAFEHLPSSPAVVRLQRSGDLEPLVTEIEGTIISTGGAITNTGKALPMAGDFTLMTEFDAKGNGTLAALAPATGKWQPDGKSLFIRGGKLVYDIGWVGALSGKKRVSNGKKHIAVVVVRGGETRLMLNGRVEGTRKDFTSEDDPKHVFKIGSTASDFGGDLKDGTVHRVMFWKRALDDGELKQLQTGKKDEVNTPDFHWTPPEARQAELELTSFGAIPGIPTKISLEGDLTIHEAWIQPLEQSDHRELVAGWDDGSFERGKAIYHTLCMTCHGTPDQEGSIPLALKFHEGEFKNGTDPFRMWQTMHKGYGLMVPQPQYSTRQKYDVIHYIREKWLKEHNPKQLFEIDDAYLAALPRGMSLVEEKEAEKRPPQYELMDFGPALFWTYQIDPGPLEPGVNMAYKGLAIRLDKGPGGVSKGKAWAVYDLDTMRLAAVYTGDEFVDWKGIAFDGSHGTHTSLVGDPVAVYPNEPIWLNPETGDREDLRLIGRDGRRFGPLPRTWVHFKGLHLTNEGPILEYTVGGVRILEKPYMEPADHGRIAYGSVMEIARSERELQFWLGPIGGMTTRRVTALTSISKIKATIERSLGGFKNANLVKIEPDETPVTLHTRLVEWPAKDSVHREFTVDQISDLLSKEIQPPETRRFPGVTTTQIQRGADEGPFAVDVLTVPDADLNPWQSWMRTSGFDFFADGKRAAVCTWMGDVWIVSGIDRDEGELKWQRICSGLFQPLGLKIVDGEIYVTCRDMIAKLHDRNGDGEIDYIENFNNDHQVTEHFHEFAMGLQTDDEGNFYYAKSARHAKTALVPHHGTLLRVSPDGKKTDILASGFRAANGVCLNPDGSFIVTDQEGHWNPKNRINWVRGDGPDEFFGNIFGYTSVTDESDDAMTRPMCWITNAFDRSPAELLWVPEEAKWGPLNGSLLNLSYGYGKIYVCPHEFIDGQPQGGMCELPMPQFPTGVMRGRFHPGNGQFYGCGMFAWAGSQHRAGGFYRVRHTGKPALLPLGLKANSNGVTITFSDPIGECGPEDFRVKTWDLKRTASYGSKHYDERELPIKSVGMIGHQGTMISLEIPGIEPTRGMEIRCRLEGTAGGDPVDRVIHNTIHQLPGSN